MLLLRKLTMLVLLPGALLYTYAQEVSVPPDAPTVGCKVTPSSDPTTLRVLTGTESFRYVFACNVNKNKPGCLVETMQQKPDDSPSTHIIAVGTTQGAWSCVFLDGVSGWMPTARLMPLPAEPAVPVNEWFGWYRQGKDTHGIENDRLLLTKGKTPGSIHVSGRAYWYGLHDVVHFGQVNAEAKPFGRYLHLVDGDDPNACVLELVADPTQHSLIADDNSQCGGMNVRFRGNWTRFTPSTPHRK